MRRFPVTVATGLLLGLAALSASAQDADPQRAILNAEICTVDGLTATQCDCVWKFLADKLSPADLRLGLLLLASNSDDPATAKNADQQLDKMRASDRKKDALSSEMSALVIEAEDACE